MTEEQRDLLTCRLVCIENAMKVQNSGADTHMANTILTTTKLLLEDMRTKRLALTFDVAVQIVQRLEKQTVVYFQRKYSRQWH